MGVVLQGAGTSGLDRLVALNGFSPGLTPARSEVRFSAGGGGGSPGCGTSISSNLDIGGIGRTFFILALGVCRGRHLARRCAALPSPILPRGPGSFETLAEAMPYAPAGDRSPGFEARPTFFQIADSGLPIRKAATRTADRRSAICKAGFPKSRTSAWANGDMNRRRGPERATSSGTRATWRRNRPRDNGQGVGPAAGRLCPGRHPVRAPHRPAPFPRPDIL